jgi:hypothetical protein
MQEGSFKCSNIVDRYNKNGTHDPKKLPTMLNKKDTLLLIYFIKQPSTTNLWVLPMLTSF